MRSVVRCGVAMCTSSRRIKVRLGGKGGQGKRTASLRAREGGRFPESSRSGSWGHSHRDVRIWLEAEEAAAVRGVGSTSRWTGDDDVWDGSQVSESVGRGGVRWASRSRRSGQAQWMDGRAAGGPDRGAWCALVEMEW